MGVKPQNFALLILEEDKGRFMNSQMTKFFHVADRCLCSMMANDEGFMWDELDIEELSQLTPEQLIEDYQKYCEGKMNFNPIP